MWHEAIVSVATASSLRKSKCCVKTHQSRDNRRCCDTSSITALTFIKKKQKKKQTQCLLWLKLLTGSQRSSTSTELKDRAEFTFLNTGSYFGNQVHTWRQSHISTVNIQISHKLSVPQISLFTLTYSCLQVREGGREGKNGGRRGWTIIEGGRCLNTVNLCYHLLAMLIHGGSFGAQIILQILDY